MWRSLGVLALSLLLAGCGGGEGAPQPDETGAAPDTSPTSPAAPEPEPGPEVPASLLGTEWEVLPTSRKVVALTFDCGANADGVRSILSTLEETGAAATFLTGSWARAYPALAAEIGAGYPVGNHTLGHVDLTGLTDAEARREIRQGGAVVARAAGRDPRPLFRFPYGARDARTIALVNALGYGSVRWTVDSLGWQGTAAGRSAETVEERVLAALRPGAIVLMHVGAAPDGSTLDADALPTVVAAVRARGYRLVALDAFVG
ncbi:MAG TPA: polysaccharide deacetylase family protein [Gaiellaceae bacterium]|nr:polysaccharide deacetylase family protein [Gaiellaceae bacterium]